MTSTHEATTSRDRAARAAREEREAVNAVLYGTRLDRMRAGARALGRLLRDPNDTAQIFVFAVALDRGEIPNVLLRLLCEPGGLELLHDKPALDATTVDTATLAALPENTFGHAYARHMLDANLDADLFQAPPDLPPVIAYFAQRFRQTHDVWHVLSGCGIDVPGEIALQAFCHGQLGTPAPALAAIVGSVRYGLGDPSVARRSWDAYRRGKRARFLLAVRWEALWAEPLDALRARFCIDEPAA